MDTFAGARKKTAQNQPSIYTMKLHDVIALIPKSIEGAAISYFSVMRVAGGWIYQMWDGERQCHRDNTFVPFNKEFNIYK